MLRILLGAILGAALTSVAFIAFDWLPSSGRTSVNGAVPLVTQPETAVVEGGTSTATTEGASRNTGSDLPTVDVASNVETSQPDRIWNAIAERLAAQPPPTLPMDLPPEFDYLAENPNLFHERLQREAPDPGWFVRTQSELYGYFSAHPEIAGKYGFPDDTLSNQRMRGRLCSARWHAGCNGGTWRFYGLQAGQSAILLWATRAGI